MTNEMFIARVFFVGLAKDTVFFCREEWLFRDERILNNPHVFRLNIKFMLVSSIVVL